MQINKFNEELLALTRDAWFAAATEADIPLIEYEMNLDWAAKHIDYANPSAKSFAYGIFSEPGAPALAIIDVVYRSMTGPDVGWLKLLTLMLSPDYAPSDLQNEAERLKKTLEIYAEAISGMVKLTGDHASRVIKVYSRSDSQYKLLFALNERLNQSEEFKSKMQGSWLVLNVV